MFSERELERRARHRLEILTHAEEVSGSIAATCRYFGISRNVFYRWQRRYEEFGIDGLKDRSKRPHHSPNATEAELVEKIIHLRQNYHFGPQKIAMYLTRYHQVSISCSGVWRILKRLEMNRLPTSQRYKPHKERWKRYEKQRPGHHVQVDVKFLAPIKDERGKLRKHYQFTAIDDCTRLRVLRIYPRCDQKTAIAFIDYIEERFPFKIETIQTDNGSEFQSSFHWHVLDKGYSHKYIKPATPRLNGKVERSHRIDGEEFYKLLEGVVIDDSKQLSEKLQEWENYYNFNRPHGGIGGRTPYEKLLEVTKA